MGLEAWIDIGQQTRPTIFILIGTWPSRLARLDSDSALSESGPESVFFFSLVSNQAAMIIVLNQNFL